MIFLVALVVLGPERMPALARKAGQWTAELRRAASELRAGLESELGDVTGIIDDVKSPLDEVKKVASDTGREMRQISTEMKESVDDATGGASAREPWVGPKPVSGPTPGEVMDQPDPPLDEAVSEPRPEEPPPVPDESTPTIATAGTVETASDAASWVGPRPLSGPTPEDAMADLESIERTGRPVDEAGDDHRPFTPRAVPDPEPLEPERPDEATG